MTEEDWLASGDPEAISQCLTCDTPRKWRLLNAACCRRLWGALSDARSRSAVGLLESYADDLKNEQLRLDAFRLAADAYQAIRSQEALGFMGAASAVRAVLYATHPTATLTNSYTWWKEATEESERLAPVAVERLRSDLLRCIFGNPFRPVTADPTWLTSTVVALARGIYDDRAFDRLPILADALQDAGCDNADVLNHCRGAGPHARGCWVVDLVLGKV